MGKLHNYEAVRSNQGFWWRKNFPDEAAWPDSSEWKATWKIVRRAPPSVTEYTLPADDVSSHQLSSEGMRWRACDWETFLDLRRVGAFRDNRPSGRGRLVYIPHITSEV